MSRLPYAAAVLSSFLLFPAHAQSPFTPAPLDEDILPKARDWQAAPNPKPPTEFRAGHVTLRKLGKDALQAKPGGFEVTLPSRAPVTTPTVWGEPFISSWHCKVAKMAAPGLHFDGGGLSLSISATGSKKWVFRFKRRDMGLGGYPAVSLADARQKAAEAREMLARGEDPIEGRKAAEAASKPQRALTFDEAVEHYYRGARGGVAQSQTSAAMAQHTPYLCQPDHWQDGCGRDRYAAYSGYPGADMA